MTDQPDAGAPPDPAGGPGASPLTAEHLRAAPGLAHALRLARAWGVAPTAYLGDSRWSRTSTRYDALGRVVEVLTEVPGWTENDRQAAEALAELEAGQCPDCGGELAETTRRSHEFAYEGTSRMCHRCAAVGREAAKYDGNPAARAIHYGAVFHEHRVRPELDEVDAPAGEDGDDDGGRDDPAAGGAGAEAAGGGDAGPAGRGE